MVGMIEILDTHSNSLDLSQSCMCKYCESSPRGRVVRWLSNQDLKGGSGNHHPGTRYKKKRKTVKPVKKLNLWTGGTITKQ